MQLSLGQEQEVQVDGEYRQQYPLTPTEALFNTFAQQPSAAGGLAHTDELPGSLDRASGGLG